jgi:uncharacterized membrane protein
MTHAASLASQSPAVIIHLVTVTGALLLGPVALWARKGSQPHRAAGYAWVTLMTVAIVSALFIVSHGPYTIGPFGPIHLLIVVTGWSMVNGIRAIMRGEVERHRKTMRSVYFGACIGAGVFTLLPGRYLGDLLWHHGLGLV